VWAKGDTLNKQKTKDTPASEKNEKDEARPQPLP
jgi:hypothetical protein